MFLTQVARDFRVEENFDQFSARHDELGDEVHIPVPRRPQLRHVLLLLPELIEEVAEAEGSRLGAIVIVPVEMQNSLALNR